HLFPGVDRPLGHHPSLAARCRDEGDLETLLVNSIRNHGRLSMHARHPSSLMTTALRVPPSAPALALAARLPFSAPLRPGRGAQARLLIRTPRFVVALLEEAKRVAHHFARGLVEAAPNLLFHERFKFRGQRDVHAAGG